LQVFYELHAERERQGKQAELAIVRLEQLAPFPFDLVCRELYRYPNAEPIWCQEEPMNMGAYFHVQVRVLLCFGVHVIILAHEHGRILPRAGACVLFWCSPTIVMIHYNLPDQAIVPQARVNCNISLHHNCITCTHIIVGHFRTPRKLRNIT
jgi:hypothetical protein